MKTKKIFITLSIIVISFLFIIPNFIFAEETTNISPTKAEILNNTKTVGNSAGYANADKNTIITTAANTVKIILSFLGIIFLILVIISGFQWMTAQGNEDAVKKARARIKNAIIGITIILFSYSLVAFIEFIVIKGAQGE